MSSSINPSCENNKRNIFVQQPTIGKDERINRRNGYHESVAEIPEGRGGEGKPARFTYKTKIEISVRQAE